MDSTLACSVFSYPSSLISNFPVAIPAFMIATSRRGSSVMYFVAKARTLAKLNGSTSHTEMVVESELEDSMDCFTARPFSRERTPRIIREAPRWAN